jgi:hypothetical protein
MCVHMQHHVQGVLFLALQDVFVVVAVSNVATR